MSTENLRQRHLFNKIFRLSGIAAISIAMCTLLTIFGTILYNGVSGFFQTHITLKIALESQTLGISDNEKEGKEQTTIINELETANYPLVLVQALEREIDPVQDLTRSEQRSLFKLLSQSATTRLQQRLMEKPDLIGKTIKMSFPASSPIDQVYKGNVSSSLPAEIRKVSDQEMLWLHILMKKNLVSKELSYDFFFSGDSRTPELAGIASAFAGSIITIAICFILSFPLGVGAAVYLEEFAKKNRFTELIEVSINNLAAVPSIIFGLLGLAVFINFFGMPRSTPLVGGCVLALMTLPTIIISCRAALKAVPPTIRYGALAMGASPVQTVFHHVVPAAMPGTLTGTIIGLSQALGETAPLIMIGMVAFIVDIPSSPTSFSSVLPVQIYLWAENPERGFVEKTSAAIIVILLFLASMNALAVYLRQRWEKKW